MQFIISALINSIVFSRLKLIFRIIGENNFPTELLLFGSGRLAHSNYGFLFFLVEIWIMNQQPVRRTLSNYPRGPHSLHLHWYQSEAGQSVSQSGFNWVLKEVRGLRHTNCDNWCSANEQLHNSITLTRGIISPVGRILLQPTKTPGSSFISRAILPSSLASQNRVNFIVLAPPWDHTVIVTGA